MTPDNPYQPPAADLATDAGPDGDGKIRLLSASGRLGRVRYLAYSTAVSLLFLVVAAVLGALGASIGESAATEAVMMLILAVAGIAMLVVSILLTVQRIHDFNTTGWLALLAFVPLVGSLFVLALWFIPGTDGTNDYGPRTPPNTTGVIVLACIAPAIFIGGILAAILVPAYQDYASGAQTSHNATIDAPGMLADDSAGASRSDFC